MSDDAKDAADARARSAINNRMDDIDAEIPWPSPEQIARCREEGRKMLRELRATVGRQGSADENADGRWIYAAFLAGEPLEAIPFLEFQVSNAENQRPFMKASVRVVLAKALLACGRDHASKAVSLLLEAVKLEDEFHESASDPGTKGERKKRVKGETDCLLACALHSAGYTEEAMKLWRDCEDGKAMRASIITLKRVVAKRDSEQLARLEDMKPDNPDMHTQVVQCANADQLWNMYQKMQKATLEGRYAGNVTVRRQQ